ncbi:hypothetical protein PT283_07710 [Acetobacteraceae bacterium ESL0697]|nr:hypothetical protein [Acetobacteraceae bacterium ESL0697]
MSLTLFVTPFVPSVPKLQFGSIGKKLYLYAHVQQPRNRSLSSLVSS